MKRIPVLLSLLIFLVSCVPGGGVITDVTSNLEKTRPKVVQWNLDENNVFTLSFSKTVEVKEAVVGDITILKGRLGSSFSLPLPFPLSPGEKCTLSMTVEDERRNKTRFSFLLKGKNNNIPSLIINELSMKGTQSNPDRIELYVLSPGDTAGVLVEDDKYSFSLPSIKVNEGDLILIYWDKTTTKKSWERDRGRMTYVLSASSPSTLGGTEGLLLVKTEEEGEIMDAVFYSEKGEDAFKEGEKNRLFLLAKERRIWEGEPFDSSLITSSRVMARLPGAVDSDSQDDFFITAPRRSTFGELNEYAPYQGT